MKRNQVNAILGNQVKRRNTIIKYALGVFVLFVVMFFFLNLFISANKTQYVKYTEKSDLEYQVYLKENEFFEGDHLDEQNKYIASLIDYVKANFKYDLLVDEKDIDYQYIYRIDSEVVVKEKDSDKHIYEFTEELFKETIEYSTSSSVTINKSLDIDYNRYNDLINRFVSVYDLDNIVSTLNVNMYVTVIGDCEEVKDANTESVISLSIPLTTKTVGIDMKYDLVDEDEEKLMVCEDNSGSGIFYLILAIASTILNVILIVCMIRYIIRTRTAESIYDRELKKILNNYKSYIQKVNNKFELGGYQIVKVDTFTDMLEIRDTVNQPILMVEDKDKTGTYFIIPSHTKILYTYALKIKDIQLQLDEKNIDVQFEK